MFLFKELTNVVLQTGPSHESKLLVYFITVL